MKKEEIASPSADGNSKFVKEFKICKNFVFFLVFGIVLLNYAFVAACSYDTYCDMYHPNVNTCDDPLNCGDCFYVCTAPHVSSPVCDNGNCKICLFPPCGSGGCSSGYYDCNGVYSDGCECASPKVCYGGSCITTACSSSSDCTSPGSCQTSPGTCISPGTPGAYCQYNYVACSASSKDGCCPPGCTSANDVDCTSCTGSTPNGVCDVNEDCSCADCACKDPTPVCDSILKSCVQCSGDLDCQETNKDQVTGKNVMVVGAGSTPGKIGTAYKFNGINNYITTTDSPYFNLYNITITFWINATNGSSGDIINKYYTGSLNGYRVGICNKEIYAWYFENGSDNIFFGGTVCGGWNQGINGSNITLNQWTHIAFVVNYTGGYIYRNGVKTGNLSWTKTPGVTNTTQKLSFGITPGSTNIYFNGSIDEIKIWGRVLTPTEIAQEAVKTAPGISSDERAYFSFNNNPCNGMETCFQRSCFPGTSLNCDDGKGCTIDSCDIINGCLRPQKDCGGANCIEPSGVCSYVGGVYFASMNRTKDRINKSDVNDLVRIYLTGTNFNDKIDYQIYKVGAGLFWTDQKVAQGSAEGYVVWRAGMNITGNIDPTGDYYFLAKLNSTNVWNDTRNNPDPNYRYLHVVSPENNFIPFTNITSLYDENIYLISESIPFSQSSFDEDDFIDYVWDLGDGITKAGDSINYENYEFTFNGYTSSGQKNIRLDITDGRGATVSDSRSIFVINPNVVANYTFAYITNPKFGESVNGPMIKFNATASFAISVNSSGNLTCIAGDCPGATTGGRQIYNSFYKKGDYSIMNFSWSFDDGDRVYIPGSNGTNFTKVFGKSGQHLAELAIFIPAANSLDDTSFNARFVSYCEPDGLKYWNATGSSFNTLTSSVGCGGPDKQPGGDNDCCPANYGCTATGCVLNKTIQSICANVSFCSDYKDPTNCSRNLCRVGSDSACGGIVQANANCGDDYFVKINCTCTYNTQNNKCELNSQLRSSVFSPATQLIYYCNTTTNHGVCTENGFMIVQMNSTLTGVPNGCNLNDSLCSNEQGSVACGAAKVRLPFFTFFNFTLSIVLIIVVYMFLGFKKKEN